MFLSKTLWVARAPEIHADEAIERFGVDVLVRVVELDDGKSVFFNLIKLLLATLLFYFQIRYAVFLCQLKKVDCAAIVSTECLLLPVAIQIFI